MSDEPKRPYREDPKPGQYAYCDACGRVEPMGSPVVHVGCEPQWDSGGYAALCFRCVKAALDELTRPTAPQSGGEGQ